MKILQVAEGVNFFEKQPEEQQNFPSDVASLEMMVDLWLSCWLLYDDLLFLSNCFISISLSMYFKN